MMQRLVQGDVGAGKTMIAWFSSLRVIENGFQAVWMAPTELLAEQHYRNIQPYAENLAIKARLMTGSLTAKERKAALDEISKGGIQLVVGTHALIQKACTYRAWPWVSSTNSIVSGWFSASPCNA